MLCGSAFKNKGVQPLLDGVVDFLPSPMDIPPLEATEPASDEKIIASPPTTRRRLPVSRSRSWMIPLSAPSPLSAIYSGMVSSGTSVLNSVKDNRERVGRMLLMHANNREDIKEAYAGDIVAFAGLKNTTTGETLCDPRNRSCSSGWNSPIR